jgi:hypothetical protein
MSDSSLPPAVQERVLRIVAGLALAAMFTACVSAPAADLDMWHEMALIRESLQAGALLTHDVFAYTPTVAPMANHEWGAGAILYLLGVGAGAWAVVAFKFTLAAGTAALVLWCARTRKGSFPALAALAPWAMLLFGLGCATLRAQAYSFVFLAALLCFLELDDRGKGVWVLLWVPMFVAWVNLHGGCVAGIAVLGCYAVEQALRRRPFMMALGAIVLAVALMGANPFGLAYYSHLWRSLQMPRPEILEWQPLWRFAPFYLAVFGLMLAVAAYAVAVRGVRACRGVLILAALAVGSLEHVRMAPMFAIAWMAYVPGYVEGTPLATLLRNAFRKREAATAVAGALTALFLFLAVTSGFWRLNVRDDKYPIGAVQYLAEKRFAGHVMTPFVDGAYVSWRLFPAVKVSMDSRYDIAYPPALAAEHFAFYAARPGWRETLAKYPTDLALVPRTAPVARLIPGTGWTLAYRDRNFELYARPGLALPFVDRSERSFSSVFP